MFIPESIILNTLKNGFSQMAEGSGQQLLDVFSDFSPLDISRLHTILSNKKYNIILGFPPSPVKDTTLGLTLGSNEETEQFIGSAWNEEIVGLGTVHPDSLFSMDSYHTMFQGSWRITIYATNADLGVSLSYLAAYLFLSNRPRLTSLGLLEQRLSILDFEPIPQYLPDVVFVRAVVFSAKIKIDVNKVTGIDPIVRIMEEATAS